MSKPYIICHMMMSVDGRIDCAMTEKLAGTDEYYETLNALEAPTTVSGRVTAEMELGCMGRFETKESRPIGREAFSKQIEAAVYNIVMDTHGTLLWPDDAGSAEPMLVITSEQADEAYLARLDSCHISWIACGKKEIDLPRAVELLHEEFGVERMAVVGGGTINGGFLAAGLLDEVSILLGPGIDGRKGMTATFDGLSADKEPTALKLKNIASYPDGAVWLRYQVI